MQNITMTTLEKLGEKLFRLRDYTPIPFILLALYFANPTCVSLGVGLIFALIGEFTRMYGVAFIGTISRTRSYSNGELVTSGPFMLMRNPLYFGNLLLSLGLAIMPGIIWLPILFVVFFYCQYIPIVAWEEMKLRHIFGQSYAEYCATTPHKWFPGCKFFSFSKWFVAPESWLPALKSEKRTLTSVICFVAVISYFYYAKINIQVLITPYISNF